jgi:hypothetical protein
MAGKSGRSGGKREGAGRPPGTGGTPGAGRPEGAIDIMPRERSANGSSLTTHKWAYAEKALAYAEEAIEGMVHLMRHAESEAVRLSAMDKILDRALGKAPAHIDVTAMRHTEIVYRSAEEIRQECIARGVPPFLLEHMKLGSNGSGQEPAMPEAAAAEIEGEAKDVTPTLPQDNGGG